MSGKQRRKAEKNIARRAMRNLQRGSVTRASRDLDAAEALQGSAQVLEKLEALHPDAPPPTVPDATAVPVQITRHSCSKRCSTFLGDLLLGLVGGPLNTSMQLRKLPRRVF